MLSQLKVLSTTFFSALVLNKVVSAAKWRAIIILIVGCILVASPMIISGPNVAYVSIGTRDQFVGLIFTCIIVLIGGMSSVYFEKILKTGDDAATFSVWDRNVQMAAYSIVVLVITRFFSDDKRGFSTNLFVGWSSLTFVILFVVSLGGLLVAATLKYADAILKCFSTSCSIVLSTFIGFYWLESELNMFVCLGIVCTVVSLFNYTCDDATKPPEELLSVSATEKKSQ